MKLDILAFGAHPDDVELGCGGTLLIEKKYNKNVGIVDLTQGELGTRGTPESRKQEAEEAASFMQLDARENLNMADGFFKNDKEHQLKIITTIRKYQPEIVLCNAPADRHPDHGNGADLIYSSAFLSGLSKIETKENSSLQKQWRPKYVFNYIQDKYFNPDFVVNITEVFDKKIEAIKAYKTQFHNADSKEPETYISTPEFLESIIYRAKMFGKLIGVKYAEGFISQKMIGIKTFDALIQKAT